MPFFETKEFYNMQDLLDIVAQLRDKENGCPWDLAQTHESIRQNFIEETYEAVDAIDKKDVDMLKEELGDVLLQVVLHTQMEQEIGQFNFEDVCDSICKKLIYRHPHIFSTVQVENTEQVLQNWDTLKERAKGQKSGTDTILAVPTAFPALMRAQKVQKRASKAGMDFENFSKALTALKQEIAELECAVENEINVANELGDVLFSTVNLARFVQEDAEEALTGSTNKFITRFVEAEKLANTEHIAMQEATQSKLNEWWQKAKELTTEN